MSDDAYCLKLCMVKKEMKPAANRGINAPGEIQNDDQEMQTSKIDGSNKRKICMVNARWTFTFNLYSKPALTGVNDANSSPSP
mmetsp:Transcript_40190/g.62782  ORF Transcript_40190/g.62782 Transcript_40190/m.62782 type:complete len:83 (+) Transcript_40190:806-1054(+)